VQGTRPLGAIILVKFHFFQFWGRKPPPLDRSRWRRTVGPLLPAKFHLDRCNVSPLRGENPQIGPWVNTIPTELVTRNKSNDYFESLQYRQDLLPLPITTTENTSLATYIVLKITIIRAQKIGKFAIWNLILCTGAIWRGKEKFEYGCTTTYHPL